MAQRRRKEEPEDLELPEFDEAKYMRKDMASTRAAIATILLALPFAIGSFGLALVGISALGFLAGVVGMFALPRLLPLVRIPTEGFARKDWISHAGTMFLCWLAFWILLMNPPFSDFTPPEISRITVNEAFVGEFTQVDYNETWGTTWINATVSDNVAVREVSITIEGIADQPMNATAPQVWGWQGPRIGTRDICITAVDQGGHTATRCFEAL